MHFLHSKSICVWLSCWLSCPVSRWLLCANSAQIDYWSLIEVMNPFQGKRLVTKVFCYVYVYTLRNCLCTNTISAKKTVPCHIRLYWRVTHMMRNVILYIYIYIYIYIYLCVCVQQGGNTHTHTHTHTQITNKQQIKLRWALFVTYTIIQSIMRSEMCSLHLTHPRAHTPGAVGSRHCGARGAVGGSVPCPRVSPQLWTLPARAGIWTHNLGLPRLSSQTLSIRPRLHRSRGLMAAHTQAQQGCIYSALN